MVTPQSTSDEFRHEETGTASSLTDLRESNWLGFSPNFRTILKIYVTLPVIIMKLKGKDLVSGRKVKFCQLWHRNTEVTITEFSL